MQNKLQPRLYPVLLGFLMAASSRAAAQSVAVILRLDTNAIPVGGSTLLHVYAQVVPALRMNADRIFSWYVDVLNTNGMVARMQPDAMQKPASDNDPQTSSFGFDDGASRRGIYDTFLNLPGAGVSNPVELIALPLTGLAAGQTRFRVQTGTGVPSLSEDFIVAPAGGGDAFTGGDYSAAFVDLNVLSSCEVQLTISRVEPPGSPSQWLLNFNPCAGYDHTVEYVDQIGAGLPWQAVAGAPHNSGSLTITTAAAHRFYRVKATLR